MKLFKKMSEIVLKICEVVLLVSGNAVPIVILTAALMRYILKINFGGYEEIVVVFALWMYFIGSVLATSNDSHIQADMTGVFFKNVFFLKKIKFMKHLVTLSISLMATSWAFKYLAWSFSKNPKTVVFKFPMTISQTAILVSFILMSAYSFVYTIRSYKEMRG